MTRRHARHIAHAWVAALLENHEGTGNWHADAVADALIDEEVVRIAEALRRRSGPFKDDYLTNPLDAPGHERPEERRYGPGR
jgi:hypothetical protein